MENTECGITFIVSIMYIECNTNYFMKEFSAEKFGYQAQIKSVDYMFYSM